MIGRSWRGGRGGRDEFVSSLRRKRDEFVASRRPRVPTQSLVSRFCITFPGRPRFESFWSERARVRVSSWIFAKVDTQSMWPSG